MMQNKDKNNRSCDPYGRRVPKASLAHCRDNNSTRKDREMDPWSERSCKMDHATQESEAQESQDSSVTEIWVNSKYGANAGTIADRGDRCTQHEQEGL
jgi:hypothetical protein